MEATMAAPVIPPSEEAAALAAVEKARVENEKLAKQISDIPNALPAINVATIDSVSDANAMSMRDTNVAFAEVERLGLPVGSDPVGEDVMERILEGKQSSAEEYRLAELKLEQMKADRAWTARLMDGDPQ